MASFRPALRGKRAYPTIPREIAEIAGANRLPATAPTTPAATTGPNQGRSWNGERCGHHHKRCEHNCFSFVSDLVNEHPRQCCREQARNASQRQREADARFVPMMPRQKIHSKIRAATIAHVRKE